MYDRLEANKDKKCGLTLSHQNNLRGRFSVWSVFASRFSCSVACAALTGITLTTPTHASTYVDEKVKCAVGGEEFEYMALASISRMGGLPDGMPIGSGDFPIQRPQCPSNGLVMYRDFKPEELTKLAAYIASPEYKALRNAGETAYYLAYQTAKALGDPKPYWLLLSASWEAKNENPTSARARRYNEEFVAVARAVPADGTDFESIALQFRVANALRELGQFDEAAATLAAIVIAPNAGGIEPDAENNRAGWKQSIAEFQAVILRKDANRAPIDLVDERDASFRCLSKEAAKVFKKPAPMPLTAFEVQYCARPELADELRRQREFLKTVKESR